MISGLIVLSDAVWGCYPFLEAIHSFMGVVDEMVVVINPYGSDDTEDRVRTEFIESEKVRVVHAYFDLDELGWKSYGVVRTTGYQACHGDIVVMFDADGVLHEKDVSDLESILERLSGDDSWHNAYWEKFRMYTPALYWRQHKHSGIYNKKKMGDRFDFYNDDGRGIPNWNMIRKTETEKSINTGIYLFGYEHMFDTRDVVRAKAVRYGMMRDRHLNRPLSTADVYYDEYIKDVLASFEKKGEPSAMPIELHPACMQEKLRNLTAEQFGYNLFGAFHAK